MKYDVDYFLNKFQAIPEDKWNTKTYSDLTDEKRCAFGWCGMTCDMDNYNTESSALFNMFSDFLDCYVTDTNDGKNDKYQQLTPKKRILAALYDIRKMHRVEKVINDLYPELSQTTVEDIISEKVL